MKKILGIMLIVLLIVYGNAVAFDSGGAWDSFRSQMANPGTIGSDATPATNIDTINLQANATLGSELITWTAAGWNEDASTWTFAGGVLTHVTGNTTAVTGTVTGALTVGRTVRVAITGTGGVATATYTLGGNTGTTIAASGAIAIVDFLTTTVDSELVITPANTCTVAITNISVKELVDGTGDETIDGNLTVRSPATFNDAITAKTGTLGGKLSLKNTSNFVSFQNTAGTELGNIYWNAGTLLTFVGTATCPYLEIRGATSTHTAYPSVTLQNSYSLTAASGQQTLAKIASVYNQTSTAAGTDLLISRTETAVGSGAQKFISCKAGAAGTTENFFVDNAGNVNSTPYTITPGAGTVAILGAMNRQLYKITKAAADFTDTDTTKGIVIATLPAKTKIVGVYADTTVAYTGGAVSAATLEVGVTAEGAAEILAAHNVLAAPILAGDADAEMGTSMTRAAAIQGGYMPSWTGTTAIYATIDTTTANTDALTAGSTTFYIETERF